MTPFTWTKGSRSSRACGDHTPNPHDAGEATSWSPTQAWAFIGQF